MTLHIDLPEEIEQRVLGAAARHNLPVEQYVLSIVESSIPAQQLTSSVPVDFAAYLRSLASFAGKVPNYPADFWTREIVSGDDD